YTFDISRTSFGECRCTHATCVSHALVEPACVDRSVHEPGGRPGLGHAVDGCLASVRRAVVDDPEHPVGAGVRFGGHDLLDKAGEGADAGARLAAAKHLAPVHIPSGQVGKRPAPVVFVLDAHHPGPAGCQGGVAAAAGLDGGLLVRAEHVVTWAQRLAVEDSGV